jgi:release factor glutamine methyltransferase
VRFEPLTALVAANEGLADLDHIVSTSRQHLLPGGWLLVEHGWTQGEAVALFTRQGTPRWKPAATMAAMTA